MNYRMLKLRKSCLSIIGALFCIITAAALEPGAKAPDFSLNDFSGKEVSLSDFEGKIVVLEWINQACPFVKKHYHTGAMQDLQEKYKEQGVIWIGIQTAAEDKLPKGEKLAEIWKKEGSKASQLLRDPNGTVAAQYNAKNTPHMVVIGKTGMVEYIGGIDDKKDTKHESVKTAKNYVVLTLDALLNGKEVEIKKAEPYGCAVTY